MKPKVLAFDWETTGLLPHNGDRGFAISFCDEEENQWYWKFPVDPKTREVKYPKTRMEMPIDQDCEKLFEHLADPSIIKVGHNVKFDMYMCEKAGLTVAGEINDTMIAARCCYTLEPIYGLKALAKKYLHIDNEDEIDLQKQTIKWRKQAKDLGYNIGEKVAEDYWLEGIFSPDTHLVERYCKLDTLRTMRLWQFYSEGMKQLGVYHSYLEEMQTMKTLIMAEKRGVKISLDESRHKLYECIHKEMELITKARKMVGWDINLGSGQQLAAATTQLGIDIKERTKPSKTFPEGQISTASKTLRKYKHEHEFIDIVLRHSGATTGKQYFTNYLKHAMPSNNGTGGNIIHPNFRQGSTKTFRLSCSNPNLQNVANDKTSGGEYVVNGRSAFLPRDGYIWICIDYAQLELRIFADRAQEQTLLGAFRNGRDPHNETRINVPFLAKKDKAIGRKLAKNTNFTIIFCGGPRVLNERYGIPLDEAQMIFSQYHVAFPDIKTYQYAIAGKGKFQGYITNAFDRKLNVDPDFAYRAASYDIQSSAADLMKRGMNKCHTFLQKEKLDTHIVLSIHDEIVFEMNKKDFDINLIRQLKTLMEDNEGKFCISTPCDVKIVTERWSEKEELKV